MLVIAGEESTLVESYIDISTEVAANTPVGTETTKLNIELAVFGTPLVVGIVGICSNLVVVLVFNRIAESRTENAQVNYGAETIRVVFCTKVCSQEGVVKRVVGIVVVKRFDGLCLDVSCQLKSFFVSRFCSRANG